MKYIVPLLLGPLLVAAFAVAYWGPVRGYSVECRKDVQITCAIERETSSATTAHRFTLGSDPKAVVRVKDVRKGPDRILLYLVSSVGEVFAAEFEGGSALSEAEAAAARLNGVFAATQPSEARVDVSLPAYLRWMLWGAVAFLALLVLAAHRAMQTKPAATPPGA